MCWNRNKTSSPLFLKSTFGPGFIIVLILITGAVSPAMAQTCTGIPDGECQALYALYNNTGGTSWTDNTNWLSAEPAGDWFGITVDGGHVTEVYLYENGLTGAIPSEMGNLNSLEWLQLNLNSLSGEIPAELGNLGSLVWLDLPGNDFTGEIPSELSNLSNLERLSLASNFSMSGEIPPELGNLSNLEYLILNSMGLSGEIPAELGNLSNLTGLYLHVNELTGEIPSELSGLTNLHTLYLSSNKLNGEIPPELGNLSSLTGLYLQSNKLTGEIPPELGNLSNLERLFLHTNSLIGEIPVELGNLANIENLYLASNALYGDLPVFLATPPENIDLSYNCLYASNPAILATMETKHSGEFISTQTLPPENVSVEVVESGGPVENRVLVSWDPISYVEDEGGSRVFYKRTTPPGEEQPSPAESGSDYHYSGMTFDKEDSSLIVSNLEPGTDYTFRVNTVTWSHRDNENDLQSPDSETNSVVSGTLARAFIPIWKQAPGYWTGVVASNFGTTGFSLNLAAYDPDGALEPLDHNPATSVIGAGLQKSLLGSEFLGAASQPEFSWIELGAENSNKMGSIFLFGVSDTQMMDGAESQSSYAKKLFFTRPLDEGLFYGWQPDIQMCLVNPTDDEVTVSCTIKGYNGESTNSHTIPSKGFIAGDSEDLTNPGHGIYSGYLEIEVTEGAGVVGFSRIEFPGVRTALGMNAVKIPEAQKMYSAQLAHGLNIVTSLILVNTSEDYRRITLTAIGDDGTPLADPVQTVIYGERIYSANLGTLFGLEGEGVVTTGSLVVESDGRGVIGDIIFAEGDTMEYAMSLPLQTELFQEAVFNHITNLPTVFTGFAFFNPGDETATVLIEAIGTDGLKVAEKTLVLAPGERIARTLTDPDIWPGFPTQSGGYIKIQSDKPIAGQQLFGDRSLRYMAAIPPTTRVEAMFD
jgi:Leucine-rich repeat (LRR) protein